MKDENLLNVECGVWSAELKMGGRGRRNVADVAGYRAGFLTQSRRGAEKNGARIADGGLRIAKAGMAAEPAEEFGEIGENKKVGENGGLQDVDDQTVEAVVLRVRDNYKQISGVGKFEFVVIFRQLRKFICGGVLVEYDLPTS